MAHSRALALLLTGSLLAAPSAPVLAGPAERSFHFTYTVEVQPPAGTGMMKLWIPYPVSDASQVISNVQVKAAYPTEVRTEAGHGNSVLFLSAKQPQGPVKIEMTLLVKRLEYLHRPGTEPASPVPEPADALKRWLRPDRLVPLDKKVRKLAGQVTAGKKTDLEKARAIYDYTVSTMKYDKSGTGWGNGDIHWACDAKRGNCTDFHALFIGLCRASGIPARFSIGFPIPAKRGEGEVGGYHCWAEFYLKGYGWVPVDASEAAKNPDKRDYYFGAHDENRVQFSTGRDVKLTPPQSGAPLNYFIYPYVEVDGKELRDLQKSFSYQDVEPDIRAAF